MTNNHLFIFICSFIILISIIFILFYSEKEKFNYPYYPFSYQSVPEYIYKNDPNIRLMGSGDLLVWNNDPIMPLLIKCRNSKAEANMCNYIISSQKIIPTTP
jgi:hypothetical protein